MFLMKKIVGEMLAPLPVCLGLIGAGLLLLWFTRKKFLGKVLASVGFVLLTLLSIQAVSGRIIQTLESQYKPLDVSHLQTRLESAGEPPVSQIVVLAGGISRSHASSSSSNFKGIPGTTLGRYSSLSSVAR